MSEYLSGKNPGKQCRQQDKDKERMDIFKCVNDRAHLTLLFPLIMYVLCVCVTFSI